jgi:putative ABC transport system ATP-binding protein
MSQPFLEARHLCKSFRAGSRNEVQALVDISLTIDRSSFTVLSGPSGSGKTTLLALLGVLDRPSSGQVLLEERNLTDCSDFELARVRRRFGFVFQNFALIPHLPVWENITYPLIPRGLSVKERWAIAQEWLGRLGLADRMSSRPGELSGGEQQRVAVARALAGRPELILADEPISNLDPQSGQAVLDLLRQAHGEGVTVILSAHDPAVLSLATAAYELEAGRLKTGEG